MILDRLYAFASLQKQALVGEQEASLGKHISWFDMVSPKELKRREEAFRSRVFPFGDEQKKIETDLLRYLLPEKKPEDSLYQVVLLKEIILNYPAKTVEMDPRDFIDPGAGRSINQALYDEIRDWQKGTLTRKFNAEEQEKLLLYAWKSAFVKSMDDFPEADYLEKWIKSSSRYS